MKKIVFGLLAFTTMAFGQIENEPGDFHKVTSFDKIDVILIPAKENKVLLNGGKSDKVEVVNKNGELKIRMQMMKLLDGDDVSATVYYTDLDAVEANEGSRIACETKIKSDSFDIIAKEGSEIKLILDTDKLTVRGGNGSNINLSGYAKTQEVLMNSGGIFDGEKLKTQQTTITCNAGGEAHVFVTDLVDAKVRAGGNITIHGKPKKINQKVIAGGNIKEAK
jgi:hypothetical protein